MVLLIATRAHATDSPEASRPWYGWQIALVDAASVGAFVAAIRLSRNSDESTARAAATPFFALGTGLFIVGGPAIHIVHGNDGAAARSILLRLFLPLGGAFLLAAGQHGVGAAVSIVGGFAAGGIVAAGIDWAFSRDPAPNALRVGPLVRQGG